MFSSDNFPASFVELSPVFVGPGVGPTFVFGVHANLGWVFASKSLGIETLLHSLLPQLLFLPLLKIVLFSLQPDNGIPELLGLGAKLVRVHSLQVQRLDSDRQGDLFLFFELFLGLGHFPPGIQVGSGCACALAGLAASGLLLLLLSLHHGLTLHFSLFKTLLFLLSLLGLLFGLFLAEPFLLFLLLLGQFLFLLGPDLLAFGLFFLEPLQFFFLLATLLAPFVNVFPKLFIEFTLLLFCLQESLALL